MTILIAVIAAFAVAVVAGIDHRVPLAGGLWALAIMGVLVALDSQDLANLAATIAFFLLAFATALALIGTVGRGVRDISLTSGIRRVTSRLRRGK